MARPGSWNQEIIWLFEQMLGLGNETDIPQGLPGSDVIHYLRADVVAQGAATEIVLQMPTTTRAWSLVALTVHRTVGTGTTFAPHIGQISGFAAGGPDDRLPIAPRAVATPVDALYQPAIPMHTDSDFRLHLRPGFDTAADNELTYQVWFRQVFETAESTP